MKLIVIIPVFLSVAYAKPLSDAPKIISYETERDPSGSYRFYYSTSDGQTREENGVIKNGGTDNEIVSVKGFYNFVGTDGILYSVSYTADENGYQPVITEGRQRQANLPVAVLGSLLGGGIR